MKITLTNIIWNVDDETMVKKYNLPSEVTVDYDKDFVADEYDEDLADYVSNMFGAFPIYEYSISK